MPITIERIAGYMVKNGAEIKFANSFEDLIRVLDKMPELTETKLPIADKVTPLDRDRVMDKLIGDKDIINDYLRDKCRI